MRFFIFVLLTFSNIAWAILPFEDATSPEFVTSARALAMGNAYMSKVDDGWAAFYNPAGLGTVRGMQMHLTNIHLETNNGWLEVTGNGGFADAITNYTKSFQPAELRTMHANNPGNISHAKLQLFPNVTYRGITLGYMYVQQNRARLRSLSDNFEIAERIDSGPVMALSASLFGGIVKLGATGVLLSRKQMQKDFLPTDPVSITSSTDYVKGAMTHITGGVRITLPFHWLPTFSGVVRNTSNADWHTPDYSGVPEKIPQTYDASFSLTPNLGRTFRMHMEIASKDMGNRYDTVASNRKLMGGIEFDYMRSMFVRFGFGDGWGSGGIGVRNKSFAFDLTTYAIEGSDTGYRQEEDRRYILSISGGF